MISINIDGIESLDFIQDVIQIGRDKNSSKDIEVIKNNDNSVNIFFKNKKTVSRKHCKILKKDFQWYIEDLNSKNGTFLNSRKIEPEKEYILGDGDSISLGSNTFLLVKFQDDSTYFEDYSDFEEKIKREDCDATNTSLEDINIKQNLRTKLKTPNFNRDTTFELTPYTTLNGGQYRIISQLGEAGGFGITYLAEDTTLNYKVAIKEYFPRMYANRDTNMTIVARKTSTDSIENFEWGYEAFKKEAQTIAHLPTHNNVIDVKNLFEENGTVYFVMTYTEGEDLESYLKKHHPLTQQSIENIIFPILDGIKHIHKYDILHRDIKLSNILISKSGRPIIIDFGTARNQLLQRSRKLTTVYTEGYASLEQQTGSEEGKYTDIYSIGMVMYSLINGITDTDELPSAIKRLEAKYDKNHCLLTFPTNNKFSKEFIETIKKAVEIQSKDRPQNVEALIKLLNKKNTIGIFNYVMIGAFITIIIGIFLNLY